MSSAQKDKAGWGGAWDRKETWAEFDQLPEVIKRAYWFAPYDYTAVSAFRDFVAGVDPDYIARSRRYAHRLDREREVRRIYGPSHPQAGAKPRV